MTFHFDNTTSGDITLKAPSTGASTFTFPPNNGTNGYVLSTDGAGTLAWVAASGGSVSTLSVITANGFAGSVANATTTPEITLSTTVTGLIKGNGTAISAATVGTDYSVGTSALATGILKSTTGTGALSIAVAGDFPTLNQNTTGSAATLTTSRNINGVAFNGSADITVTAAAGTLTGTTLASGVTASSLTSVGTLTSLTSGGNITFSTDSNLVMATGAVATTATDGFLYLSSCPGTPTGTPSSFTGRVPMVWDSATNILYGYNGGWQAVNAAASGVSSLTGTSNQIDVSSPTGAVTLSLPSAVTIGSLTLNTANLAFTTTGQKITGDMSTATLANRLALQSSTTNGNTNVTILPNGTSVTSGVAAYNNSTPTNSGYVQLLTTSTEMRLVSGAAGSGTLLPLSVYMTSSEIARWDTSGNYGVGTTAPNYGSFTKAVTVEGSTTAGVEISSTRADGSGLALGGLSAQYRTNSATHQRVADISFVTNGSTTNQRGADILLETKPNATTGNPITRLTVDHLGNTVLGTAALATTASDGFLYMTTCPGTPTGTPTSYTGRVPLIWDTTTDTLYGYNSGWQALSGGGGVTSLTGTSNQVSVSASTGAVTVSLPSAVTIGSLTLNSGNLAFTTTGQRITGDFSHNTITNRVIFQTSTTNGTTDVVSMPNGTGTVSRWSVINTSDPANHSRGTFSATGGTISFGSTSSGTGSVLPMTFNVGGVERTRIDTSGNFITKNAIADQSSTVPTSAPNAGSTTISNNTSILLLSPNNGGTPGTIATYTLTFPSTPVDGQFIKVSTTQTITALTLSPNSGQTIIGTAPSTLAIGSGFEYIYNANTSAWYPISLPSSGSGVTSINASGGTTGMSFTGGPVTSSGTLTLTGTLAIANGGTGQTTASAGFNALSPITTAGDLIIGNGSNSATRLAIGTNNQVLTSNGTTASWQDPSGGGGATITDDTTTNATYYPTFATATSGTMSVAKVASTKLTYNPSTGDLTSVGFVTSSDQRLKYDIAPITDGLEVVNKLQGKSFKFKEVDKPIFGFIAQEVQQVLPQVVSENAEGMLGVNYSAIIAHLVESIKTLEARIIELEKK